MGISNKSVEQYFLKESVNYQVYIDDNQKTDFYQLLKNVDYVIKSPGIKMDEWLIIAAKSLSIKVITDLELFYLLKPNLFYIAVTGTNGKTTVVNFTHTLLEKSNYNHYVVGNIGVPIFSIMDKVTKDDIILVETSSYMLEGTEKFTPKIYTITNIYPHHLDHHDHFLDYYEAKVRIIDRMDSSNVVIYPRNSPSLSRRVQKAKVNSGSFAYNDENATAYFAKGIVVLDKKSSFFGNQKNFSKCDQINILNSLMIMYYLSKLKDEPIFLNKWIEDTKYLTKYPYRCQEIYHEFNQIIYNDSKATNPFATLTSLQEVIYQYPNAEIILIAGGHLQEHNYQILKSVLRKVNQIYLYGENRFLIRASWNEPTILKKCFLYENLEEVVNEVSKNRVYNNRVILFSPMSSSYDQFISFEERGKIFNELIKEKFNRN